MRIFIHEIHLKSLIDKILVQFGKPRLLPSDCKTLSAQILEKTGKNVSETTLKRLLGFAQRTFDFSLYSLEAFAIYAGYDNWDNFIEQMSIQSKEERSEEKDSWYKLKKISTGYSLHTIQAIRNSSGIPFHKTIERHEFTNYLKKFLSSKKNIAPVIAPAGFGKSVGMAHAALTLWLKDEPQFPDDICCFMNVHQLVNIPTYKHSLSEWFLEHLSPDEKIDVNTLMQHKKGRLVLIIDGFDDRAISMDKQKLIFANIAEFANLSIGSQYIKIVLAMRSFTWKKLRNLFSSATFFENNVFIDESYSLENYVNHTLHFTPREIKGILEGYGLNEPTIDLCSDELVNFLAYPGYMELFCNSPYINTIENCNEGMIIYKLTESFVKHHAVFDICRPTRIIDNIAQARIGAGPEAIMENEVVSGDQAEANCYVQLFDKYILMEDVDTINTIFPVKRIKFATRYIEEYFLAYSIFSRNNYVIDEQLFDLISGIKGFNSSRTGLVKWFIVQLAESGNHTHIHSIFRSSFLTRELKIELFQFMVDLNDNEALTETIQQVEAEHHVVIMLFDEVTTASYIVHREYFLLKLLTITEDVFLKKVITCTLFIKSLLEMKIPAAEVYIKAYRQLEKNERNELLAIQYDIMRMLLDVMRYETRSDFEEEIVTRFIEATELAGSEAYPVLSSNFLMLSNYFLFSSNYALLHQFTTAFPEAAQSTGIVLPVHFTRLMDLMRVYSILMKGDAEPGALSGIMVNLSELDSQYMVGNCLVNLVKAKYFLLRTDFTPANKYAKRALIISQKHKLSSYSLFAYAIIKEACIAGSRPEVAVSVEESISDLMAKANGASLKTLKRFSQVLKVG